jgi:2-haloacid dehalogenase
LRLEELEFKEMTTPIKAIIFDFGGVLLQWDPWSLYRQHFPNETDNIERFFKEADFAGWNAQQDRGRPFKEGVAVLSAQFPQYSHLIQAYHDHWIESIVGELDGTVELFDLLDQVVLSGEVGYNKPEPEIYQITLERIDRPANECLFIDDSLANIQQAQRMGFQTIHFESPDQLKETLERYEVL